MREQSSAVCSHKGFSPAILFQKRLKTVAKRLDAELLNSIKNVIAGIAAELGIKVVRVVLFGSRARGDFREDSDWDLLVIIDGSYDKETIRDFKLKVRRALIDLGITPELVVAERNIVEKYKDYKGFVYYYALSEGVTL